MAHTRYLFKGTIPTTTTTYVGVPIAPSMAAGNGYVGTQIAWLDATSAATITLELTNYDPTEAPVSVAGAAHVWKDSGITIAGPTGAAAGSTLVNLENVRQKRGRFKIVTTANSSFEITE